MPLVFTAMPRVSLLPAAGLAMAALITTGCRDKTGADATSSAPDAPEISGAPEKVTERVSPNAATHETNPVLPPAELPPPPGAVAVEAPGPAIVSPPAAAPSSSCANPNRPPP